MLQATLQWRKDFKIDEMHTNWTDTLAVENATGKTYVRGYDKLGNPLIVMRPRCENTNKYEGNLKHVVYSMERAVAAMEKTGQEKLCLLIDFEGYSLFNAPPMKTSQDTLSILQNHYPERLHRAYCVRPPTIFYAFYRMISPFIDPVTVQKVAMLTSSDMSKADNQLYREIDRSTLETCFGGEDNRPFVSQTYLAGDFGDDYNTILNKAEAGSK